MANIADILGYPQYEQGGRFNILAIPQLLNAAFNPEVRQEIDQTKELRRLALQNAVGGAKANLPFKTEQESFNQLQGRGQQQQYEFGRRKGADQALDVKYGMPFEAIPTMQGIDRGRQEMKEYQATEPLRLQTAATAAQRSQEELAQLQAQGKRSNEFDQAVSGMSITMPDGAKVPYHQAKMMMELQGAQRQLNAPQGGRDTADLLQSMTLNPLAMQDPGIRAAFQQALGKYGINLPQLQAGPNPAQKVEDIAKRVTQPKQQQSAQQPQQAQNGQFGLPPGYQKDLLHGKLDSVIKESGLSRRIPYKPSFPIGQGNYDPNEVMRLLMSAEQGNFPNNIAPLDVSPQVLQEIREIIRQLQEQP